MARLLIVLALIAAAGSAEAQPSFRATYGRGFDAGGTEPFWSLWIRPGRIRYRTPDGEGYSVQANGPVPVAGGARWTSRSGAFTVTVTRRRCNDGMSDSWEPYTVELRWTDGGRARGCASRARSAAWPAS
jgi:uncharacterized membrane protein